jgi:hypothetical protein
MHGPKEEDHGCLPIRVPLNLSRCLSSIDAVHGAIKIKQKKQAALRERPTKKET